MDNFTEYEMFVDAKKKINYYKGDVLPFIHKCCRKDMTTGDIDGFIFDYKRKIYYVLEQKWTKEKHKESQDIHLQFLVTLLDLASESERFSGWTFGVYKIIGNPPFANVRIIDFRTHECKTIDRNQFVKFLELDLKFENFDTNDWLDDLVI